MTEEALTILSTKMSTRDRTRYNSMPSVEDAHAALEERHQFPEFLTRFSSLSREHSVAEDAGAFLLHAHFKLGADQIMLERSTSVGGTAAYATQPVAADDAKVAFPMRWYFAPKSKKALFRPMEFTSDPGGNLSLRKLAASSSFIRDYRSLLLSFELGDLLGLCSTKRIELPCPEGASYREETDFVGGASILRVVANAAESQGPLIDTTWKPDVSLRCVPQFTCVVTHQCIFQGPGQHNRIVGHRQEGRGHSHLP